MGRRANKKVVESGMGKLVKMECSVCGKELHVQDNCVEATCNACLHEQGHGTTLNMVQKVKTGPKVEKGTKTRSKKTSTRAVKKATKATGGSGKRGKPMSPVGLAVLKYMEDNAGTGCTISNMLDTYMEARKAVGKYSGDVKVEKRNLASMLHCAARDGKCEKLGTDTYRVTNLVTVVS